MTLELLTVWTAIPRQKFYVFSTIYSIYQTNLLKIHESTGSQPE